MEIPFLFYLFYIDGSPKFAQVLTTDSDRLPRERLPAGPAAGQAEVPVLLAVEVAVDLVVAASEPQPTGDTEEAGLVVSLGSRQDGLLSHFLLALLTPGQAALSHHSPLHGALQLLRQIVHLRLEVVPARVSPGNIEVLHVCQEFL